MQDNQDLNFLKSIEFILQCVQPLVNLDAGMDIDKDDINMDYFAVPGFPKRQFGLGNVRFEMAGVNSVTVSSCFPNTILGLVSEISDENSTLYRLTGGLGNCRLIVSGNVVDGDNPCGDIDLLSIEFDLLEEGREQASDVEIPLLAPNSKIFESKWYLDCEDAFPQIENGPSFNQFVESLRRCSKKGNDWRYFSFEEPKVVPQMRLVV